MKYVSESVEKMSLIFLHVPKAAGTTFQAILNRRYSPDQIFSIYSLHGKGSMEGLSKLPESERERILLLKGHFPFGIHKYLPNPSRYIAILREPVDRVVSHYYFVLKTPGHHLHDAVKSKKMSLEEYVFSGITVETDNDQVRLLSGHSNEIGFGQCTRAMLEEAKRNIRDFFPVVGLTERFDETLLLMMTELGWTSYPVYHRRNVTRKRPLIENIPTKTINEIKKRNELDQELYEFVRKNFEERIKMDDNHLERELRRFHRFNAIYQVSTLPKRMAVGSLKYIKAVLERGPLNSDYKS